MTPVNGEQRSVLIVTFYVVALFILLVTGCARQPAAVGGHQAPRVASQVEPAEVRGVGVGLTEWTIVVSRHRVSPGRVVLTVTNTGATQHDLVVQGRAGTWKTPVLNPGRQVSLVVHADPGETLALWCSEPGHRAQGMHTTLTVRARATGAGS